ncbi:putative leucine-rich repeat-containing protein [Daphnia sinensis]|uniref:Leucine-rich repeat-containing protein n=1 Tax=Daphnia sinensis TaxID=1820382 RepID=A0AAD5PSH7_9CRUS|nr:putative leucine-rich repeat-containing protein [Daphnia sinensis]
MFSFFRKKTASKDSKPEQQPPDVKAEEEDKKIAESNKKRTKNDKKSSKDKKGSFKSETEPVIVSSDNSSASSIVSNKAADNVPLIALIAEDKSPLTLPLIGTSADHVEVVELPLPSDGSFLLQEEPPDEFCEAHEVILPELPIPLVPITLTQPSQLAPADASVSETTKRLAKDLPEQSTKDKQPRRVSFNCKDIVISDPGDVSLTDSAIPDATHVLPITITQRDLDEAAQSPFLSEEASAPLHEISIVQQDGKMSTQEEDQTDLINAMKEQIHRLELELREKTERVEQLEAILADEERQVQLEVIERLEADWNKERELIDNEREEELRLLQEALEEALEEKAEIESKMLRDASRESQLLDDFEWKLGEIEREYKKKLVETEKSAEERFKNEMAMEYQKLVEDKRDIDEKLTEIAHLKSYEAEVIQLRGLVFEQQRVIRTAARQVDHLKETEKILEDDLHRIRMQGCTRKQQQEMEAKWKENSLIEYNRLRAELVASNEEEMLKAIRQVVREKDDQIAAIKKQLDTQQVAMNHQIAELKNSFQQREAKLNKQVEETRAEADRELCELRRQLNKVQDSHVEFMEQLERKHAEELEQRGSSNEESKEALEQSYEEKLQSIEIQHQSQLNALQSLIEEEKQEALTQLGEHYQTQLQSLQEHISDLQRRLTDASKMQRSEDRTESNRETSSSRRRGSDDESTASTTESSGEEDYDESTPPNG